MEDAIIGVLLFIVAIAGTAMLFRHSPNISRWLKEKRTMGDVSRRDIQTLLEYGIEDAGERLRDKKQREIDAIEIAKSYKEPE